MTRRVLAPLIALEAIQEGPEIVRDLAHKLAQSLGILEREPLRARIKALSQNERAELRKQGVRFGAYYLFIPALIKPGPRTLAVQLWSLRAPGDVSELPRALGPIASSGRTSLSLDKGISPEGYRVAGYRPCGERIVRVDIIERLAGMIRAAIIGETAGVAPVVQSRPSSKGFVVSGQMTSLTGCSGEQFASILRSMGFRPVEMKRSDFFGSAPANEAAELIESSPPEEDQGPTADGQASPPAANEGEAAADAVSAAPAAEPLAAPVLEDTDAAPEGVDVIVEGAPLPGDTAPPLVSEDASERALGTDTGVQAALPQTSGSSFEPAENSDMIVVWRPDHRRLPSRREKGGKQPRSATPGRADAHGHSANAALQPAPRAAATKPNRLDQVDANEKRRQRPKDHDMARSNSTPAPQPKAKVDPNSPFAKLLELRPLLEGQANKRR